MASDTIGNITSYNGSTYTWLGRQLQSISNSDNSSTTYSYNADGQRIAKVVNGKDGEKYTYNYYYNGDILAGYKLVISDSNGNTMLHTVTFMYDENGDAFGFSINGKEYFYVKNAQNDVIAIVDSNNETVVSYKYDSWGKLLSCEDTTENQEISFLNPYTYRSYFYDSDTEMYFLKSRYYNPELHRFISADSVVAGVGGNILGYISFTYSFNNPVNFDDINGNWPKWVKNAVKTVASKVVRPIVKRIKEKNEKINMTTTKGVNVGAAFGANVSGSFGVTKDKKGNVGVVVSVNTGGGSPTASLCGYKSKTNAPTIYNQRGFSAQIGGSVDIGVSLGMEYSVFQDSNTNDIYQGATISAGLGVASIPAELHGEIGYSWVYGV